MNREALFSVLKLFAYIFRNGDAGCDFFVESSIEKKFLGVLLKEEEKKKFREYYGISKKEIIEKIKNDPEAVLKEVLADINRHHLIKSKFLLIVYLFETIKISFPQAVTEMEEIADRLNLNKAMYSFLFDFAFSPDPYSDHTDNTMVVDGMKEKIGNYVHFPVPDFKGELLILKLREFDFLLGRSFYPKPIFVNDTPVMNDEIFLFEAGQTIRQGAVTISFSEIALDFIEETIEQKYSLAAENVGLKFSEKAEVLRNINLCEESGNMVGIMGASGAGKTTLLNVLTGIEKPTSGEVRINGSSLHKDPLKFEGVIGYISQDDLLLEELSVFQNLYFNAQLIFKNVSKPALKKMVLKTLANLGLLEIKDLKVGSPLNKKISGGQRKRLNIALELIREPAVLFVDEPTSGLSSRDSEMVMQLLKELARKGKLIFVVIHQPSSDIYKLFDKIVILDTGGYQVFYGKPQEAPGFFKTAANYINSETGACDTCSTINPEIIFNILEEKIIEEDGVYSEERKISPAKWFSYFKEKIPADFSKEIKEQPRKKFVLPAKFKQWLIFSKRDFLSKAGNFQYLFINLLEAPVLAAILAFIVRYTAKFNSQVYVFRENENIPAYIFMSVIVMLFLGMSVSAEEMFKDKKILKREKFLHLSRLSYLLSKAGLLFALSALQAALFVSVGNSIIGIKGMFFPYFLMLFSVACASNLLGLIISSAFNSVVTIYIMIPLLLIPQMILGGAMFSYDKLNSAVGGGAKVPVAADFMLSRWGYEGLAVHQFMYNNFDQKFYESDKKISALNYKMVFALAELSQAAQDARTLVVELSEAEQHKRSLTETQIDSEKTVLEEKLELLRNEIKKELKADSTKSLGSLKRMYRGFYTRSVADITVNFFNNLQKEYTNKFLAADREKDQLISGLLESDESEKKFLRIKDQFSNDYLSEVVKRKMSRNKTIVENGELKQLVDAVYLDPEESLFSFDTHFFAPRKYFFGKPVKTLYFNILIIWLASIIGFIILYFDLARKMISFFERRTIKK